MKELDKKRKVLLTIILGAILGSTGYLVIKGGDAFREISVVKYFDGCKEKYRDGILYEGNCSMQKAIYEEQLKLYNHTYQREKAMQQMIAMLNLSMKRFNLSMEDVGLENGTES